MKTSARPELKEPVQRFLGRLAAGERRIPLQDLAALFGADEGLQGRVAVRGDLLFGDEDFSNDGPELVVPAGRIELEIPSLLKGRWSVGPGFFRLAFPSGDFAPRACASIAILRKCFELKELHATESGLTLDFGHELADRHFTY